MSGFVPSSRFLSFGGVAFFQAFSVDQNHLLDQSSPPSFSSSLPPLPPSMAQEDLLGHVAGVLDWNTICFPVIDFTS